MDALQEGEHLGHLVLQTLKKRPNAICQIDAATGEEETNASVLARSIQLARCFRAMGLKPGDVVSFSGRNCNSLQIPFFAAMLNGHPASGVDPNYKYDEMKVIMNLTKPKVAFCHSEMYEDYDRAMKGLGIDAEIVTFEEGENSMENFMKRCTFEESDEDFAPAKFDLDKIYAWLVSTSGTTGVPKVAAFRHQECIEILLKFINMTVQAGARETTLPSMHVSSVQWFTAYVNALYLPCVNRIKVQTSALPTVEHLIDVIHKYKPTGIMASPALFASILNSEKQSDLTCFNVISMTGAKTPQDVTEGLKRKMRPGALLFDIYGQTETMGPVFYPVPFGAPGFCGPPMPGCEVKIVDPETNETIDEPNRQGELWYKGLRFMEYYNNPEETEKAFSDGWYKTGDIFYKDEQGNYHFVERLKMLIKYRHHHVTPVELEDHIRTHPGVLDVCVTSVYHKIDGEHPVACVVRRRGHDVTKNGIEELVASTFSDGKRLRGGVIFMDKLPYTSTGKLARAKLRKFVNENK